MTVREVTHSHSRIWNLRQRELGSEQDALPFLFVDGGVRALIDPGHARVSLAYSHESRSKAVFDATARQRALLERLGLIERDWFSTSALVYCEVVLMAETRVTLRGAGTLEPDPDTTSGGLYRDGVPMRLRFTGTKKHPLVISDDRR